MLNISVQWSRFKGLTITFAFTCITLQSRVYHKEQSIQFHLLNPFSNMPNSFVFITSPLHTYALLCCVRKTGSHQPYKKNKELEVIMMIDKDLENVRPGFVQVQRTSKSSNNKTPSQNFNSYILIYKY
jgi:hypothetical protein